MPPPPRSRAGRRRRDDAPRARSTSASVVVQPSDSRRAPAARAGRCPSPPARATARGRRWRTPRRPRRTRPPRRAGTAAPRSRCPRCRGGSGAGEARPPRRRRRSRPHRGSAPSRPSASRSRRRADPRHGSRPAAAAAARSAAAMPTMPATLWVPLRRSRSWPPPSSSGASGVPSRTTRAPDALRSAELVGADGDEVGAGDDRGARRARGTPGPRRCARRRRGARRAHQLGDLGQRLDRADLVVGQHHRDERHVGGRARRPRASRSTTPAASTATVRPPTRCDRDGARRGARRRCTAPVAGRAAWTPSTARLSASVPPPVNTTSPGRQPRTSATTSRASSTAWRAGPGHRVGARGVAEPLAEERQHRLTRLGPHRRRRGVVEVGDGRRHRRRGRAASGTGGRVSRPRREAALPRWRRRLAPGGRWRRTVAAARRRRRTPGRCVGCTSAGGAWSIRTAMGLARRTARWSRAAGVRSGPAQQVGADAP